jgi:ABC-type nickel/cobalt efflux system permease component RcnA
MSQDHDHHDHGHAKAHVHAHAHAHGQDHAHGAGHEHTPARVAADDVASVLMRGAGARIGMALAALVLLWAAVAWALTDLTT